MQFSVLLLLAATPVILGFSPRVVPRQQLRARRLAATSRRDFVAASAAAAAALAGAAAPATAAAPAALVATVDDTLVELAKVSGDKKAFTSIVLTGGTASLPRSVPFITFQKLEGSADPDSSFMEDAVEYAEAHRAAKDLARLAQLAAGGAQTIDPADSYAERAWDSAAEAETLLRGVRAALL